MLPEGVSLTGVYVIFVISPPSTDLAGPLFSTGSAVIHPYWVSAQVGRAAHAANTAARRVFGKCNRMIEMIGLKVRGAWLPGSGTNRADGYASLWEDAKGPASGPYEPSHWF